MLYTRLGTMEDKTLIQVPVLPSSAKIKMCAPSQKHRKYKVPWQGREDYTHGGVFKDVLIDKWLLV